MARITMEEQQEFLTFPADSLLRLKVEETRTKVVEPRDGGNSWEKIEFKFKILEILAIGDGSPVQNYAEMITKEIWGSVPWRLTNSPENKLRIWSEALLKVELGIGFDLDEHMFGGRIVKGVTSTYNGRATDPKTGQPFKRHQIETLLADGGTGAGSPLGDQGWGQPQQAQQGWGQQPQQAQQGWGQPAQGQPQQQQFQQPQQQAPAAQQGWNTPGVQQQPQGFAQQQYQAYTQPPQQAPPQQAPPQQQAVQQGPWVPQQPPAPAAQDPWAPQQNLQQVQDDPWSLPPKGDQPDF